MTTDPTRAAQAEREAEGLAEVLRAADDAALVRTNFGQLVADYAEAAEAVLASDLLAQRDARRDAAARAERDAE